MVKAYLTQSERMNRIDLINHADGSEVCAAVSGLIYSLAGWVQNHVDGDNMMIQMFPGDATVQVSMRDTESDTAFEMAWIGFKQIELAHPNSIRCSEMQY